MEKKVLLIGGIAVVAVGAWAPYGAGISAQSSLESMASMLNAQGYGQVEVVDYERGWFSSDVKLNYTPPGPQFFGQGDSVALKAKISHGPIIWSNGVGLGLGQAVVAPDFSALESEDVLDGDGSDVAVAQHDVSQESTLMRLNRMLDGKEDSLSVVATLGFTGEVDASVVVDRVESNTLQGDRITFDGGTVSAVFNDEGMTGQGSLELGAFEMDKGASVFKMSPFNAVFDYEKESPGLYLGHGQGSIDQISVEAADNALTFKKVGIETHRTMVEGKVEDKTVISLGAIDAPLPITSANVVQLWRGVDPQAFTMFQGGLWGDESLTPEESQDRVKQSVNALLQPGFSYGLSVDLSSQDSSAKADLKLGFVGTPDGSEPFDFMTTQSQLGIVGIGAILKAISGELEVAVDEHFIGAIGPFAGMFMQPPYFEKKDAQYVTKGVLADGMLTMNGHPMPIFPGQQPKSTQQPTSSIVPGNGTPADVGQEPGMEYEEAPLGAPARMSN